MHFDSALSLVDRGDIDYEDRLHMLQGWRDRIADGTAVRGTRDEVEGAIIALQARSNLRMDTPEGQPKTTTYGGVAPTNFRIYSLRLLIEELRRALRR